MRIISDFHDFYDIVQGEGQDLSLIYKRYAKKEAYKRDRWYGKFATDPCIPGIFSWCADQRYSFVLNYVSHVIGFAGKIYHCLEINYGGNSKFCYSLHDVETFLKENFKQKEYDLWDSGKPPKKGFGYTYSSVKGTFKKYFERVAEYNEKHKQQIYDFFIHHKVPVFVATEFYDGHQLERAVIFNGKVKDYELYRAIDPYTAYQELSMWMGNLAAPEKEIPQISDETMRDIKGFDKWSFKKEPSKKK